MKKINLTGWLLLSVLSISAQAAVVVNQPNSGGSVTWDASGQSFTWTSDYQLEKISIYAWESDDWDVKVFDTELATCPDTLDETGLTKLGEELNVTVTLDTWSEITFTPAIALTKGQLYTFCFDETGGGTVRHYISNDNPYADGKRVASFGASATQDIRFRLEDDAPTITSVPIGPVGVLALLAGILGFGGWSLRRR